jgi:glycosyltransferase involved in cell wall biosynthesis
VTEVHVVLPDGTDDPGRPSGGNIYDRHLCRALGALGWSVHEHPVHGFWDGPDAAALASLAGILDRIPDGAAVLLDGLVASPAPEALAAAAQRLRLVVLVHMPLGHRPARGQGSDVRAREQAALTAAGATVCTSAWARRRLLELYGMAADRVHVAEPGVSEADLARGTAGGGALLCVAAVTFDKGHDVLLAALATIVDLPWHCACVGRLDRDPAFVADVRRRCADAGLEGRVSFAGPRARAELDRSYATADLLVLPSRAETYGMVVTEALARGLPVVVGDVGGVSEALGHGADGNRPGLLVAPEDPAALATALRSWLGNSQLRERLRRGARERRQTLPEWSATATVVAGVLDEVSR